MTKCKIFGGNSEQSLQNKINNFLEGKVIS